MLKKLTEIRDYLSLGINKLSHLIFPKRCAICDNVLSYENDGDVCDNCKLIEVSENFCMTCGRSLEDAGESLCDRCKNSTFSFDYGRAAFIYDKNLQKSLWNVKYRSRLDAAHYLGREAAKKLKNEIINMDLDCLCPVPIHKSRLKSRGFNQAEIMAEEMSKICSVPLKTDLIIRKKQTKAQNKLGSKDRIRNLKEAFSVTGNLENYKNICIVDDLFTTGATVEALTRLLKEAGAAHVYVAVVGIASNE